MEEQGHQEEDKSMEQGPNYFPRIFRGWFSESKVSKWALGFIIEAVLIVFSVLLALAVNEWRAERAREQKAQKALQAIRVELEANMEEFNEAHSHHSSQQDTLIYYQRRDLTPPMELLLGGIYAPANLYNTAWETAKQSGVIDHIDYELVLDLSSFYQRQEGYTKLSEAIQHGVYTKGMERSPEELFQENYEYWALLLGDFSTREQNISDHISRVLQKLDQAIDE